MDFKKIVSTKVGKEYTSLIPYRDFYLITDKRGKLIVSSKDFSEFKTVLKVQDIDDKFESSHMEEGLLCSATRDDDVYISYTRSAEAFPQGTELVVRNIGPLEKFTADREIVAIPFRNKHHHGGTVAFHKGLMYLSTGDGGPQGDKYLASQDPETLWGKILEINPDKKGSSDAKVAITVIATGLRNPWRFSIEVIGGKSLMFIGDAGWNTVEKVCVVDLDSSRVKNFGWSYFEGSFRVKPGPSYDEFDHPIFEYPTKYQGQDKNGEDYPSAIIGGFLIDKNTYIFGDVGGYVRIIENEKSQKLWYESGIAKIDDGVYSMARVDDRYLLLCAKGIYEISIKVLEEKGQ